MTHVFRDVGPGTHTIRAQCREVVADVKVHTLTLTMSQLGQ